MEIFSHLISDLNRHLDLSLILITDGRIVQVVSMNYGIQILEMNCSQTLDLFKALTDLKNYLTSYFNSYSLNKKIMAGKIQQTIFIKYNFDIEKHYKLQKNGNY